MIERQFKRAVWTCDPHELIIVTTFDDGLFVEATPGWERDLPTARECGYGDNVLLLWLHHDLLHSYLYDGWSPNLRGVVTGIVESDERRSWEEWRVLEIQRRLNCLSDPCEVRRFVDAVTREFWEARCG